MDVKNTELDSDFIFGLANLEVCCFSVEMSLSDFVPDIAECVVLGWCFCAYLDCERARLTIQLNMGGNENRDMCCIAYKRCSLRLYIPSVMWIRWV